MELSLTAKKSPRIENNKIVWYEGDTFSIDWTFNLHDENLDEEIDISPLDKIHFKFISGGNRKVVYECDALLSNEGKVTLVIDEEITKKFPSGIYTYSIKYIGTDVITIATNGVMEVERCQ